MRRRGPITCPHCTPDTRCAMHLKGKQHAHGSGLQHSQRTITGRLYSEIRYVRCLCGNSRPSDYDFCDRCQALRELGFRAKTAA
jgi:hypothetical protein